jgi:hypothetical protein
MPVALFSSQIETDLSWLVGHFIVMFCAGSGPRGGDVTECYKAIAKAAGANSIVGAISTLADIEFAMKHA